MAVERAARDSWAPPPAGFTASGSCVIDWRVIDWRVIDWRVIDWRVIDWLVIDCVVGPPWRLTQHRPI